MAGPPLGPPERTGLALILAGARRGSTGLEALGGCTVANAGYEANRGDLFSRARIVSPGGRAGARRRRGRGLPRTPGRDSLTLLPPLRNRRWRRRRAHPSRLPPLVNFVAKRLLANSRVCHVRR